MMSVDSCSYSLNDRAGKEIARGEASIQLEDQSLSVSPKFGEAIYLSLIDIIDIVTADFRVSMRLSSEETLSLFDLGYKFEDLVQALFKLRNEMVLKYLLMNESVRKSGGQAELEYTNHLGEEKRIESCEPRLYETSLTVIPTRGDPIRIPYSDIMRVQEKDYSLEIATEFGEKLILSRMGTEFDDTKKVLSDSMNALTLRVQSTLKELLPSLDPSTIMKVARLMKEGRAARRNSIESISLEIWKSLENMIDRSSIKKEYEFMNSLSQKERMCIGLKRGLMGDLTGDYLWFLFPIYSNREDLGNAIAMEVSRIQQAKDDKDGSAVEESSGFTSTESKESGNATYFFRITSRKDYPEFANDISGMHTKVDNLISKLNRLMLDINFRREPIYLSEDKLKEAQYRKYLYAVQKIPSLKMLRQLYIGRITHSSFEQWKSDVVDLLKFNVASMDDSLKWTKSNNVSLS